MMMARQLETLANTEDVEPFHGTAVTSSNESLGSTWQRNSSTLSLNHGTHVLYFSEAGWQEDLVSPFYLNFQQLCIY